MKPKKTFAVIGTLLLIFLVFYLVYVGEESKNSELTEDGFLISLEPEISVDDGEAIFTHPRFGYRVHVPDNFSIEQFREGSASETMVFKNADESRWFQVFATPYDEEIITEERLSLDIQSGVVLDPQEVQFGSIERALAFVSRDALVGETREVWFIHDGFLFEITAPLSLDAWLSETMRSWVFVSTELEE